MLLMQMGSETQKKKLELIRWLNESMEGLGISGFGAAEVGMVSFHLGKIREAWKEEWMSPMVNEWSMIKMHRFQVCLATSHFVHRIAGTIV